MGLDSGHKPVYDGRYNTAIVLTSERQRLMENVT
jgi:hypothetical protein